MRNSNQQKKFQQLLDILDNEPELHKILSQQYIRYKQMILLNEFENLIDAELLYSKLGGDDVELHHDYLSNYYTHRLYILYFEYIEIYEMCRIIDEILQIARQQHIKLLCGNIDDCRDGWDAVIDLAEIEINTLIQDIYGANH
jgi:hypothetical protein